MESSSMVLLCDYSSCSNRQVLDRNGWTQEKDKDSSVRCRAFLSTEDQISGRHIFQFLAQNLEFWGKCWNCVNKKFCNFYLIQNIWKINLRKESECEPVFSPAHDALWIHFTIVFQIHPGSVNRENCQMFQLEVAHSSDRMWQSVCYSQELLMFCFQAWTASQQLKSRLGALCWSLMVPCHHRFECSGCYESF